MKTIAPNFELKQGDSLEVLRSMPDESIHCAVTSPPYWSLRDYQCEGQIGLEETFDEWLTKMVEVFRELRRVLRNDATFWLNCGDAYAQQGGQRFSAKEANSAIERGKQYKYKNQPAGWTGRGDRAANTAGGNLKPKDLIGQPWALAFALRDDGW